MKRIQLKPGLPEKTRLESNHEPLYKRLPTHDEDGNFLCDFMMLIPGLRSLSGSNFQARLAILHAVLAGHEDVVFADLNTPLNLLWVSVRARHGVIGELAAEIRFRIPEARLVGHTLSGEQLSRSATRSGGKRRGVSWIKSAIRIGAKKNAGTKPASNNGGD